MDALCAAEVVYKVEVHARTDPAYAPAEVAGTTCKKCREDFPYAEPRVNFTCYGCKVGHVTPFEMNVRKLEALWRAIAGLNRETEELRGMISVACTHPVNHRRSGRWEWDNGYGTQKWLKSWTCNICRHEVKLFDAYP